MNSARRAEGHKPQTISFLSGKGGSGKTSAALSMACLLSDAGFRVLVVDFDFATFGASYFFKHLYDRKEGHIGICEYLEQRYGASSVEDAEERSTQPLNRPASISNLKIAVRKGFDFIPARVDFTRLLRRFGTREISMADRQELLSACINVSEGEYDFLLIDNQAGVNPNAIVAGRLSEKAVLVSELDLISSDAVETLVNEVGISLPRYRRYLVNKLDVRDKSLYATLTPVFQQMNRLPPLPFDFDVRCAYGSRKFPVDIQKPTAFLIALFNTVRALLPEESTSLDEYGARMRRRYNDYLSNLDGLVEEKKSLEAEREKIRMQRAGWGTWMVPWVVAFVSLGALSGATSALLTQIPPVTSLLVGTLAGFGGAVAYIVTITRRVLVSGSKMMERMERIRDRLAVIQRELGDYESLRLTETKAFLEALDKVVGSGQ